MGTVNVETGGLAERVAVLTIDDPGRRNAMTIGMVPMSLGLESGSQMEAPLGRAVIGGLLVATVTTLLFVPCVFAILHGGKSSKQKPVQQGEPA